MTSTTTITPPGGNTPWTSRFAGLNPKTYLALHYIVGFIAAGAIAWLVVGLANMMPDKSMIAEIDDAVTNWFTQHGSDNGDTVFKAISLLGGPLLIVIMLAVAGALASKRDWFRLALIAVTCGGGVFLNAVLRATFSLARPVDATNFTSAAQAWNFPSGHAMNALVCYGILAYLIARRRPTSSQTWIVVAAAALIVLVGFTRIYLGVHFLSDVVIGYASGAVWLLVCIMAYRFMRVRYAVPGEPVPL
jgi:membrane-associated phospholipid phosphatase